MLNAGVKGAAFGFRLRDGVIPCFTVRGRVVIMFTGGGRLISDADLCIHRRTGGAVVVISGGHTAGHRVVPYPGIPYGFNRAVMEGRRLTVWQADIKLILQLAVGEGHRIQPGGRVDAGAEPDAVFGKDTLNKLQVGLTPLGQPDSTRS